MDLRRLHAVLDARRHELAVVGRERTDGAAALRLQREVASLQRLAARVTRAERLRA